MMAALKAPALAAYVLAAAQGCPAGPAPQLAFDFTVKKTAFVHALPAEDIERIRRKNAGKAGAGHLSGLTETKFGHKAAIHGKETIRPDGWRCFRPVKVVVTLDYTPVVYISTAYRAGSCKYAETRRHELQHVAISKETVEEFAPVMMARLRQAMKDMRALGPGTEQQLRRGRDRMNKAIAAAYNKAMDEMMRVLAERQARIDTDSEYRRVAGLCTGKD